MSGGEKTQGTRCAFIAGTPTVGGDPQKKWDPKKLDVGTLLTWDGNGFMMKRQCGTQTMEPSQIKRLVFFGARFKLFPLSLRYFVKKAQSFCQTHNVLLRCHSWWPIRVLEGRNGGLCWFLHRDDAGDNIWLHCWCNCGCSRVKSKYFHHLGITAGGKWCGSNAQICITNNCTFHQPHLSHHHRHQCWHHSHHCQWETYCHLNTTFTTLFITTMAHSATTIFVITVTIFKWVVAQNLNKLSTLLM